jgi:hypothetical protein
MISIRILRATAVSALALLLAACAGLASREPPEVLLAKRAEQRWADIVGGKWEQAYEHLTPGFRDVTTLDDYRLQLLSSKVIWRAAKTHSVECTTEERCVVKIRIDFEIAGGMPGIPEVKSQQVLEEIWLKVDGKWYFLPHRRTG